MNIGSIKANIKMRLISFCVLFMRGDDFNLTRWLSGFFFFFFLIPSTVFSQKYQDEYPFIQDSLNTFHNDSIGLANFYRKMNVFQDSGKVVSIVQIGDSHIQADWFSGKIRIDLHKKYPNAGRGLVFPYRVAKTNGPQDIRSSSNVEWESKRIISSKSPLNVGVSGITIRSNSDTAKIKFRIKCIDSIDYRFSTICLYYEKSDSAFDILITDTCQKKLAFVKSSGIHEDMCYSKIMLDTLLDEVCFQMVKVDSNQKFCQIYGVDLRNDKPGILYNMIGVNGATFNHYVRDSLFFQQVSTLNPDLIILSLGTNDSFQYLKNLDSFKKSVEEMIKKLRANNPEVSILFTTPPDANRKKKYKNLNMLEIRNIIIEVCNNQNIAYWDLYEIMGGYGSVNKWYSRNLAQADRIHYTASGYMIQAELFNRALQNGLDRFKY